MALHSISKKIFIFNHITSKKNVMNTIYLKRLMVMLGVVIAGLAAAQKQSITKAQLPSNAQDFLNKYISGKPFIYIKNAENPNDVDFTVKYNNGMEIEFHNDGVWEEVDGKGSPIPTGFISSGVTNYTNSNYKGDPIVKVSQERGKYEVSLKSGLQLEFDMNGTFLKIK
ncbi:PepSY-like domain-containing protein [Elizabethkingia meningoseptica]|nr:PepSY-like domain-containing protein [Elizabethkingia meningoseptica]MDE5467263.1 PepSY-like domain-containing protein [Elizabethkingia meningoseptica]MDE5473507.1 PepSY-like domain-containing protein [Elizabethkingia meningoseptica]MDE5476940.1 PepSY-like domain-containing protein [Elizabethkingia meningoseptica]MDE5484582.1 PepSY-like domain-containing protein [Elizabethkingia meningoseptica]